MDKDTEQKNIPSGESGAVTASAVLPKPPASGRPAAQTRDSSSGKAPHAKNRFEQRRSDRKGGYREDRTRSEFDQKLLTIRRVARVAAGGRRFNFSVALVLGNRKGSVGVGTGKASDTSLAIDKAARNGKKHLIKLSLTKNSSISHEIAVKYSSARILLMPSPGRGLIAGSALRDVLDLAGIHDVVGKIFSGSKNKLNIARAAVKALAEFQMIEHKHEILNPKSKTPIPEKSEFLGTGQANLKHEIQKF